MTDEDNEKTEAMGYYRGAADKLFQVLNEQPNDPDVWDAAWEVFDLATARLQTAWGRIELTD